MRAELAQLERAIGRFLTLTGGPSPQLCHYLLKLVDCLNELEAGRDPSQEIADLAARLQHTLLQGVVERLRGSHAATRAELQRLEARWAGLEPAQRHTLLPELEQGVDRVLALL